MFRYKGCFLRASACFLDVLIPFAMTPFPGHAPPLSSVEKVMEEQDLLFRVQDSVMQGRWSLQPFTLGNDYCTGSEEQV